jgi:iron complex outermembrane receptor protein
VDERVLLTLGLRRQNVRTDSFDQATGALTSRYDAHAWSPAVGLVVKPTGNVSVYGNYTAGLQPGQIVGATYANAGQVLNPYRSKQYEMGVKVDWGTVTTTAAVYQLTRPIGTLDGDSSLPDSQRNFGYSGEQRNRGLELSAYGELAPGLRLVASAAFVQGKLTKTQDGINEGNSAYGVPSRAYRLGLDWDTPWVQGLSLNGRVSHLSSMYVNNENTLRLPSVTTVGLGARYRTRISGKSVVFRANVDNLTDKRYWLFSDAQAMSGTNAAGRTYTLSASIDF